MTDTRIILRNDTSSNWASSEATDIHKGELAIKIDEYVVEDTTVRSAAVYLGVETGGSTIDNGVYLGGGSVFEKQGIAESELTFTKPVVYEDIASKQDGTTVRWDATNEKWVADARVVTIDTYPTANGTVVYDASLGKFIVGAVVSATVIDGGSY